MKGTIVLCLKEIVENEFGEEVWKKLLTENGVDPNIKILPISDVDDSIVVGIIKSLCEYLDKSLEEVAEIFGDYWINVYSQRLYKFYYKGASNAKEFLLKMDDVHVTMTKMMKNANPPRFRYEWKDDKTLIMRYYSDRDLIEIAEGLVKGVAKYYGEKLVITRPNRQTMEITFYNE